MEKFDDVEEEFADVDKDGPVPVDVNLNDRPNVYISEFFFYRKLKKAIIFEPSRQVNIVVPTL